MAKDDYFVIVYKIPSYLYVKLKSGENVKSYPSWERGLKLYNPFEFFIVSHI